MLLLLDQLGGIWEITSRVTLPKSAPNWVEEELLNWPFNIQRGRREDRPGFASRGSEVRVPLAPLPRNRSSAVVFLASELIFTRRFPAAVPVACPIGFRPPSRVPGVACVSAPRPPGRRARQRSPVAARRSSADRSAPRACCCGPSAPSAPAGSPQQLPGREQCSNPASRPA